MLRLRSGHVLITLCGCPTHTLQFIVPRSQKHDHTSTFLAEKARTCFFSRFSLAYESDCVIICRFQINHDRQRPTHWPPCGGDDCGLVRARPTVTAKRECWKGAHEEEKEIVHGQSKARPIALSNCSDARRAFIGIRDEEDSRATVAAICAALLTS